MASKKKKIPHLIFRLSAFARFLNENYGYTNVRQFTEPDKFSSRLNSIFLAKDAEGRDIFIKACRYGEMCENEYLCGMELWKHAPRNFAKPLAYYSGKKFSFCSSEYLPGPDLYTLAQRGTTWTGEQKAQMVEDLYVIFQSLQKSGVVHRDMLPKNMLLHKDRIILVDCQLSIKLGSKEPVTIFNNILKVCMRRYRWPMNANLLKWDDTEVLLSVIESIGADSEYRDRFDYIREEIKKKVGKLVYVSAYPSEEEIKECLKVCRLRSMFHYKSKMRARYRQVMERIKFVQDHPELWLPKT